MNGDMLVSEWLKIHWGINLDGIYNFLNPTHTFLDGIWFLLVMAIILTVFTYIYISICYYFTRRKT
jgi:amino acid transporter